MSEFQRSFDADIIGVGFTNDIKIIIPINCSFSSSAIWASLLELSWITFQLYYSLIVVINAWINRCKKSDGKSVFFIESGSSTSPIKMSRSIL